MPTCPVPESQERNSVQVKFSLGKLQRCVRGMFWLFEVYRPNDNSSAIELSQAHIDRVSHQSPSRAMTPSTVSKAEEILRTRSDKFDVTERTSIQSTTRTGEIHNGSPDKEPGRFSSAVEYHTDHHKPDTFLLHIGAQFYGADTNNKVEGVAEGRTTGGRNGG
jgi:hypothetical protein